jgi:phage recombination protein Bet
MGYQQGNQQNKQQQQSTAIVPVWKSLPPQQFLELGHSQPEWETLTKQLYPAAKSADVILLTAKICAAQKLPVMKKPYHIVPMYNSKTGQEEDTIWPSVALYEIEAHRTGEFAGKDTAEEGPIKTFRMGQYSIEAPEWISQTVYRFGRNGEKCAYSSGRLYFKEWCQTLKKDNSYGGKKGDPTDKWLKMPVYMLGKCALAVALRLAFPEQVGAQPTAEEMEGGEFQGQTIDVEAKVSTPQSNQNSASNLSATGAGAGSETVDAEEVSSSPSASADPSNRKAEPAERRQFLEQHKANGWTSGKIIAAIARQTGLPPQAFPDGMTVAHIKWFNENAGKYDPQTWWQMLADDEKAEG